MASIRESLLDPMQVDHDAPAAKASKRAGSKWCTFKRFLVALIVVALAAVGVVFRNQFSAGGGGGGGGGSPMPPAPAPAPPAPAFNIGGISTGFDMMRALPLTSTTPIVGSFTKGLTAINGDAIPDGASVDNTEQMDQVSTSTLSTTFTEFVSNSASELGLTASYGFFSGSADIAKTRSSTYTATTKYYASSVHRKYVLQTVAAATTSPTAALQLEIDALPAVFGGGGGTVAQDPYIEFIVTHGTHFVSQMTYGGYFRQSVHVKQSFISEQKQSTEQVKGEIAYKFDLSIDVTDENTYTDDEISQFSSHSESSDTMAVGGDVTQNTWAGWVATLKTNPGVIGRQLSSIVDLIADPAKAGNMTAALAAYFYLCPHSSGAVCSNQGTCSPGAGWTCECDAGYSGQSCEISPCPTTPMSDDDSPQVVCSGHGQCDSATGTCSCDSGWGSGPGQPLACERPCGTWNYPSEAIPSVMYNGEYLDDCMSTACDSVTRSCADDDDFSCKCQCNAWGNTCGNQCGANEQKQAATAWCKQVAASSPSFSGIPSNEVFQSGAPVQVTQVGQPTKSIGSGGSCDPSLECQGCNCNYFGCNCNACSCYAITTVQCVAAIPTC